jgi:hypothetical protein
MDQLHLKGGEKGVNIGLNLKFFKIYGGAIL